MAHQLDTMRNGKTAMAFVGETPWHGLGQSMTQGASVGQWITEAGFDWSAIETPVQFTTASGKLVTMPEKKVLYRDDTGEPLSVMGKGYKVVQPREVMEFFRDLTEQGGWHIHTAGMMRGGRKMWAMASNHTTGEVVPGDTVNGNLLLATSLDGTMPTVAAMTAVRVVCANTLRMALDDTFERSGAKLGAKLKGKRAAKISHRSVFDAEAVKAEIGVARDTFAHFMQQASILAAKPCDLEEARSILRAVFGQPIKGRDEARMQTAADVFAIQNANANASRVIQSEGSALLASLLATGKDGEVKEQKSVARCLSLFAGEGMGANHEGVQGTRWGLFNAVTQHIDHEQGRSADTRLESAWFGRGDEFKQSALAALLQN